MDWKKSCSNKGSNIENKNSMVSDSGNYGKFTYTVLILNDLI